jgi:hypothetical protein
MEVHWSSLLHYCVVYHGEVVFYMYIVDYQSQLGYPKFTLTTCEATTLSKLFIQESKEGKFKWRLSYM